ncbi:subtilase family protein [Hirsutella rhossiliensis]|uniref:Subtilase family domain-containing protein n=1 Tax=Hirsutella rhossiliensis TaxID=111463 RepID=A0A9P8MYN1_9HYPO|nr:subtilase family domain-containing protein [Hirsutella rhossiliensis]KAH0964793.1 subtilase family domain-containing protein [Hirsutella rhossiliensis]
MHFLVILPCILAPALATTGQRLNGLAPLLEPLGEAIPGSYIVKLRDSSSTASLRQALSTTTGIVEHVYSNTFQGFSAKLDDTALQRLRHRSEVDFIEHDAVASINGYVVQPEAPWGIARISHRRAGNTSYVYHGSAGQGTCSYVIDTGIEDSHPEFGGRAHQIKSFVNGSTDGNGHGTHVAGIIGSQSYGVAKKTAIYGIKVLDDGGSGSYSSIIAGMDFVSRDARLRKCPNGAMANMSLGGGYSKSINAAAAALVRSGVFVTVSAGGDNSDAAGFSPASEPSVCTVGATTLSDNRASSSNFGDLVDVFSPGHNIKSTWIKGGTNTLSGSSMSAGHITGLGSYLATLEGHPGAQELCQRIQALATRNVLGNIPSGTQNLLAFNGNPAG